MLTLAECRAILGPKAEKLTDEEITSLRDLLYTIGYHDYHRHIQKIHNENRDPLHPQQMREPDDDNSRN